MDPLSFGSIAVDGGRRRRDLVLLPGGRSFKRKEIEELARAGAQEIVIGTGTDSEAGLSAKAETCAERPSWNSTPYLPARQLPDSTTCWMPGRRRQL